MYTLREIKAGVGLFASGDWTLIYQRGGEDVYVTEGKDSTAAPGWHLAGGGRILADGKPEIEWCD